MSNGTNKIIEIEKQLNEISWLTYDGVLEFSGAEILSWARFGSYQGDWCAKVKFKDEEFWLHGYFGSCSVCDSLQAEIEWFPNSYEDYKFWYNSNWHEDPDLSDVHEDLFVKQAEEHIQSVKDFGLRLLNNCREEWESLYKQAKEQSEWDSEGDDMVKFLENNK